jgi:hypothetical protein
VSKTAWILSSHPSSWTLKLCPKKKFFALANVIDTDQGNPFEVAVLLSKAFIYTSATGSLHIGKVRVRSRLEARTSLFFLFF